MPEFFIRIQYQRQMQDAVVKEGTSGNDNILFKRGEHGRAKTKGGYDVITIENGAFPDLTDDFDAKDRPFFEGSYDKIKFEINQNQKLYSAFVDANPGSYFYIAVYDENTKEVVSGTKLKSSGGTIDWCYNMNDEVVEPTMISGWINNDGSGRKLSNPEFKAFVLAVDEGIKEGKIEEARDLFRRAMDNNFEATSLNESLRSVSKNLKSNNR